jgi:alanine-synthesizing transaminase
LKAASRDISRSTRLPPSLEPNAWALRLAELRVKGAPLLDLTESNPTRVGLSGVTPAVLEALADPRGTRYDPDPRGLPSARAAVAAYYGARGTTVSPTDVVLTSGTSESYAHLFRLLANPGDTILIPSPSYPLFEPIAAVEGIGVIPYRLEWDGAWHLDLGSVEAALAAAGGRARALVVVEPNHPTGSSLDPAERQALEDLLERHGVALVSDEVFSDFPWRAGERWFEGFLSERRVPTFVLGGLSKCCGMPQLKLGWIVAAGPEPARRALLEGLEWIADLFLSVSAPVQLALPTLLDARHAHQARVRERLASNLAALADFLRRRPEVTPMSGRGGWAAVLRLPVRDGLDWALALLEREVVVHPGHFYDLRVEGCVVLGLISESDVTRRALERLDAAVSST